MSLIPFALFLLLLSPVTYTWAPRISCLQPLALLPLGKLTSFLPTPLRFPARRRSARPAGRLGDVWGLGCSATVATRPSRHVAVHRHCPTPVLLSLDAAIPTQDDASTHSPSIQAPRRQPRCRHASSCSPHSGRPPMSTSCESSSARLRPAGNESRTASCQIEVHRRMQLHPAA
jgi:hypothetical protein